MNKLILALSLLGLSAVGLPSSVPRPGTVSTAKVRAICPTTGSCVLIATWSKPGNWRATDSLRVIWSQNRPTSFAWPRKFTRATADTFPLPRTTVDSTFVGQVTLTTFRVGTTAIAGPVSAPWTAPAVVSPPDTVTGLKVSRIIVKPDSVKLQNTFAADGKTVIPATQQFCAFVGFDDGKVAIRAAEIGKLPCINEYSKFPLALRSVNADQQFLADQVCINWSLPQGGGTIQAEICGSPS